MTTIQKSAKLTASKGAVVTEIPRGVGQTEKMKCDPAGWDFVYALWAVECTGNEAEVALDLEGNLKNQTFCFSNYASSTAPLIKLNERELALGQDVYVSVDKEQTGCLSRLIGSLPKEAQKSASSQGKAAEFTHIRPYGLKDGNKGGTEDFCRHFLISQRAPYGIGNL
jgi:hypothetical protein